MKFFSKINFKIILLLGFIILLIGTILSVNFIPVSTSNMTYEEKKILLNHSWNLFKNKKKVIESKK